MGEVPDWLPDLKEDIGAIKKGQGNLEDGQSQMQTDIAEIKGSLKNGAVKIAQTEARLDAHISDPNIHFTTGQAAESLQNTGLLQRPVQWAERHPIPATGGVITAVFVALQLIREVWPL
jgi:hypothetical protein